MRFGPAIWSRDLCATAQSPSAGSGSFVVGRDDKGWGAFSLGGWLTSLSSNLVARILILFGNVVLGHLARPHLSIFGIRASATMGVGSRSSGFSVAGPVHVSSPRARKALRA